MPRMRDDTVIGVSFTLPNPPAQAEVEKMSEIKTFADGSKLLVNGERDEHGLPVAFILHSEPITPVESHPKHQGVVIRPHEDRADNVEPSEPIMQVSRVPVAQVCELIRAGVIS